MVVQSEAGLGNSLAEQEIAISSHSIGSTDVTIKDKFTLVSVLYILKSRRHKLSYLKMSDEDEDVAVLVVDNGSGEYFSIPVATNGFFSHM